MGSRGAGKFEVKRIAIIGAGPCGLASAKYLVAQQAFETIDIFEQQCEVGGVWNYCPNPAEFCRVPQVSAQCPPDPPLRPKDAPPVFPSPMYEELHTNIPRRLMQFSDQRFPEDCFLFPSRKQVKDYLVEYAKDVRHLIRFSSQVTDVRLRDDGSGRDQWDVDVISLVAGEKTTATYDAVVVASGHYSVTYIPDIQNISEFHAAHPKVIMHSKLYRNPEPFANKKVLVVGNAASGLDIAAQINRVCKKPLLLSVQTPTPPEQLEWTGAEEVPVIEEFLVEERGVKFQDGRDETDIDAVVFATGYLFTYPFLTSFKPPLVTNGRRTYGLYRHLIHIDHPTLVFPGLPIKVVPFPFCESEAAVFSRVWANVLPLPSVEDMRLWEKKEAERNGSSFHVFPKGGDAEYINEMHDWIVQTGTAGKEPPHWDAEQIWQRNNYAEAKLRFELGGRKARTLEELGMRYQAEPDPNSDLTKKKTL